MKILSIKIKHETEVNPDLSYLGEYSNQPKEHHIDRQERNDMGSSVYECRYFNGGCGDLENAYQRMERYNNGYWHMLGICAVAKIVIVVGTNWYTGVCQTITSGGLRGIESDSDDSYFKKVEKDELYQLRSILQEIGFSNELIESVEVENERDF